MKKEKQNVRFTIDIPEAHHKYIKMLAAKNGVSLRKFVISHLPNLDTAPKDQFDKLLKKMLVKKAPSLRRLSKK